jgi:hypothetical protein
LDPYDNDKHYQVPPNNTLFDLIPFGLSKDLDEDRQKRLQRNRGMLIGWDYACIEFKPVSTFYSGFIIPDGKQSTCVEFNLSDTLTAQYASYAESDRICGMIDDGYVFASRQDGVQGLIQISEFNSISRKCGMNVPEVTHQDGFKDDSVSFDDTSIYLTLLKPLDIKWMSQSILGAADFDTAAVFFILYSL